MGDTTAASGLFKDRIPTQDAEIVRRLKASGAVLLGKLNLHEYAYGGSSVISFFGAVRNPWDLAYSPGGSSGGSAAAVAAELCYGAIGTDTGGSMVGRQLPGPWFPEAFTLFPQTAQPGDVGGFLVEKGMPGLETKVITGKVAMRASSQADITLTNVRVPIENRLAFSRNFKDTARVLTETRPGIAWHAVGHAMAAY